MYLVYDSESGLDALEMCLTANQLIQEAQGVILMDKVLRGCLRMEGVKEYFALSYYTLIDIVYRKTNWELSVELI